MGIRNLINGQTIRIDNHTRGCNSCFKWNEAIHLHKCMNGDNRFNKAEVIIPLHEKGELTFRKIQGKTKIVEKQLKHEIKEAFSNPSIRDEFIKSFNSELVEKLRICDINDEIKQKEIIENALILIARFFGVGPKIQEKIQLSFMKLYKVSMDNGSELYMKFDIDVKNDSYPVIIGKEKKEVLSFTL